MMLLPTTDEMYRALVDRDGTFEGLFFARAHPSRAYAVAAPVELAPFEDMWINVGTPGRSLRTTPIRLRLLCFAGTFFVFVPTDAVSDSLRELRRHLFLV